MKNKLQSPKTRDEKKAKTSFYNHPLFDSYTKNVTGVVVFFVFIMALATFKIVDYDFGDSLFQIIVTIVLISIGLLDLTTEKSKFKKWKGLIITLASLLLLIAPVTALFSNTASCS
ncbi:hypothetical protein ACRN9G_18840 [Shewanella frigidimarina]|uniref:hypothetical protein n=1 Tax=Shewanella frigidimarina TaxID=56812 RepID=UPI003D7900E6